MRKRRKNKVDALSADLRKILDDIRAEYANLGSEWGKGGRYDPVADCEILTGDRAKGASHVF